MEGSPLCVIILRSVSFFVLFTSQLYEKAREFTLNDRIPWIKAVVTGVHAFELGVALSHRTRYTSTGGYLRSNPTTAFCDATNQKKNRGKILQYSKWR